MNFFGFSGILIGVTSCALAVVVFLHNRRQLLNQVWALFALSVAMWGAGAYMISRTQIIEEALLWWRLTHIGIILIPVFFVHFVYIFLDIKKRLGVYLTYAVGIFFLIVAATPYFIFHMRYVFGQFYYDSPPGILYTPFVIFFSLGIIYTVDLLVRKYDEVSPFKQNQIRYFLWAIGIGFIGGSTSFLPVFKIDIYPVLNFAVVLYPAIMSFAILKSGFFNIKVILTELLVIILSITLFVQIFFAVSQTDSVLRSVMFVFILGIGTWLIRSVQKEVEQREKIEKLSEDKSRFVSFASHEIRNPLSFIKGASANILEGDFGVVSDGLKDSLQKIFVRSNEVLVLVEQYLNKSRLELGQLKYDMADFDVQALVSQIVKIYQSSATQESVGLSFAAEENKNYTLHGDQAKMKEVFNNLIDNAIKFSPKGSVAVTLSHTDGKIVVKVTDTGIGISPENMSLLFREFSRAGNSNQPQIAGTGLGLFLAKNFVEAHKGKIWAESEGADKGSTFFVELPLAV